MRPALLAIVAVTALAGCGKTRADPGPITYLTDLDVAREKAVREDRLVLVCALAEWSMADKELQRETLASALVRTRLAKRFVAVHVDMTDDEDPRTQKNAERLRVVGVPTVIAFSPDMGTELFRFNEFVKPERLAAALDDADARWRSLTR